MYTDDVTLFFNATQQSCEHITQILDRYCEIAGQDMNKNKSLVVFSPNTPRTFRKFMANTLKVKHAPTLGRYLDVFVDGKNHVKKNATELVERFQQRLQGWKASLLSQAGRVTLIKSVLHSDPIYKMSVFKLPNRETKQMESLMVDFVWGFNTNGKRMHLKNRNFLFSPKHHGGLGLRHLSVVNDALLAKHGWHWIISPSSLSSSWFLNKYRIANTEFKFRNTTQDSWVWRGIRHSLLLIDNFLKWQVGNGDSIDITSKYWCFPWDGDPGLLTVKGLMENRNWDFIKLEELYPWFEAIQIKSSLIPFFPQEDRLTWSGAANGVYSPAAGYNILIQEKNLILSSSHDINWGKFWKLRTVTA